MISNHLRFQQKKIAYFGNNSPPITSPTLLPRYHIHNTTFSTQQPPQQSHPRQSPSKNNNYFPDTTTSLIMLLSNNYFNNYSPNNPFSRTMAIEKVFAGEVVSGKLLSGKNFQGVIAVIQNDENVIQRSTSSNSETTELIERPALDKFSKKLEYLSENTTVEFITNCINTNHQKIAQLILNTTENIKVVKHHEGNKNGIAT
ncbi:5305_t:CDS:2 [Cetraspora pellucida]|uniref:5305_t:CDS:1 n=1 Tax=Cetraspora pellucida TaxID=1433469 RepID=A0A9N8ZZK7_9GLOM|nr:5305_t:CDS:2 [Cetraspora pellucida]